MSNKDWTGNSRSTHVILGAAVHSDHERETHDYYATEPKALELLLDSGLKLSHNVWECACGEGHLAKVLTARGYDVYATDLIHRGYGIGGVDFLQQSDTVNMDIITNPPYKYAAEFVEKALDLVTVGHKVVMFLKIQFLESKNRFQLFKKAPPPIYLRFIFPLVLCYERRF